MVAFALTTAAPAQALPSVSVPSVVGDTAAEARVTLQQAGLRLGSVTFQIDRTCDFVGLVMKQTPAAGTTVAAGSVVNVKVGKFPPTGCDRGLE